MKTGIILSLWKAFWHFHSGGIKKGPCPPSLKGPTWAGHHTPFTSTFHSPTLCSKYMAFCFFFPNTSGSGLCTNSACKILSLATCTSEQGSLLHIHVATAQSSPPRAAWSYWWYHWGAHASNIFYITKHFGNEFISNYFRVRDRHTH